MLVSLLSVVTDVPPTLHLSRLPCPGSLCGPCAGLDSGTYPPGVDTHIEEVIPTIRAANPTVVVQVHGTVCACVYALLGRRDEE